MISKIKDTNAQLIQQYQKSEAVKKEADILQQQSMSSTLTEKVDLSSKAKEIQQIKQIVENTPDVRIDKVEELKRQIESGIYQSDTDKIAENIMKDSLIDIII